MEALFNEIHQKVVIEDCEFIDFNKSLTLKDEIIYTKKTINNKSLDCYSMHVISRSYGDLIIGFRNESEYPLEIELMAGGYSFGNSLIKPKQFFYAVHDQQVFSVLNIYRQRLVIKVNNSCNLDWKLSILGCDIYNNELRKFITLSIICYKQKNESWYACRDGNISDIICTPDEYVKNGEQYIILPNQRQLCFKDNILKKEEQKCNLM